MDYGQILARAFQVTRRYRALWLFGFLFALTGGSSGNSSFSFPGGSGGGGGGGRPGTGGGFPVLPRVAQETILVIIAGAACILIALFIISIILRFMSRGALIGLVQELEVNSAVPTVRRGFGIGADRFWPLLGIALIINIPLALFSLIVILVAAAPMLASLIPLIQSSQGEAPDQLIGLALSGLLGSIFLICCAILCIAGVALIIRPFYEFMIRACVIGRRSLIDSIREGYRIVRASLGQVILLYVLVIGIGIGFAIVMIPVALILFGIPFVIGIAAYAAANSVGMGVLAGVLIGLPMLLILIFISGLYQAFESAVWTEGYLAVAAPPAAAATPAPVAPAL